MRSNPLARLLSRPALTDQLRTLGIREDLVRAVERTAFGRQTDRDLVVLAALLDEDEVVIRLLEGRAATGVGLLVLTTRRLVFLPARAPEPSVIPVDAVRKVVATQHRGMGRLVVSTDTGEFVVDQILGIQAGWMSADLAHPRTAPQDDVPTDRDPIEELAELRTLHGAGLLDDTEYDIRKRAAFRRL